MAKKNRFEEMDKAIDRAVDEIKDDPNLFASFMADMSGGGRLVVTEEMARNSLKKNGRRQIDGYDNESSAMFGTPREFKDWGDKDFNGIAKMVMSLQSSSYNNNYYKYLGPDGEMSGRERRIANESLGERLVRGAKVGTDIVGGAIGGAVAGAAGPVAGSVAPNVGRVAAAVNPFYTAGKVASALNPFD